MVGTGVGVGVGKPLGVGVVGVGVGMDEGEGVGEGEGLGVAAAHTDKSTVDPKSFVCLFVCLFGSWCSSSLCLTLHY